MSLALVGASEALQFVELDQGIEGREFVQVEPTQIGEQRIGGEVEERELG